MTEPSGYPGDDRRFSFELFSAVERVLREHGFIMPVDSVEHEQALARSIFYLSFLTKAFEGKASDILAELQDGAPLDVRAVHNLDVNTLSRVIDDLKGRQR